MEERDEEEIPSGAVVAGALALAFVVVVAGAAAAWSDAAARARVRADAALAAHLEARVAGIAEVQGKALASTVDLPDGAPMFKATVSTGDPLTIADSLASLMRPAAGARVAVLDAEGRGLVLLDRSARPPRIWLRAPPAPDAHEALLDFGQEGGAAATELPAVLPGSEAVPGWIEPGSEAEAAMEVMENLGRTGPHGAASREPAYALIDGVAHLGAWRPILYMGSGTLGAVVAADPLGLEGAAPAGGVLALVHASRGVSREILVGELPGVPVRFEGAGAGPVSETAVEVRVGDGAPWQVAGRILGEAAGGNLLELVAAYPAGWGLRTLSASELARPVGIFVLALGMAGLILVPAGVGLWFRRPAAPPPADLVAAAAAVSAMGAGAVSQVLERFPEDRYGRPRRIGKGGMGVVLRLEDATLGRSVALKIMDVELHEDEDEAAGLSTEDRARELRGRFLQEARAMASFDHPGLPAVHDVWEEPVPHFLMEFLEGASLRDRFDEEGPQAGEDVRGWLGQAARALAHAHSRGVIHRDIKPDNLMLERSGRVRVIDFGIALVEEVTRMTRAGYFVGTVGFASPEQISHAPEDARTDVYALAATGYFLLTGKLPYTTPQLAVGSGFEPAPLPGEVDAAFAAILMRALAMDPAARPQTMDRFADLLEGEVSLAEAEEDLDRTSPG